MDFDHRIDWNNAKILKSESHAYMRRVAESFLINQKACSPNVINRNDGANFPAVCIGFSANKLCLMYLDLLDLFEKVLDPFENSNSVIVIVALVMSPISALFIIIIIFCGFFSPKLNSFQR